MNTNEYLKKVLESQDLEEDSEELKALRQHRKDVEALLRRELKGSPSIRYGGSIAKDTLIKESYDLDILCYFDHDDTVDGDTLKELYDRVAEILEEDYFVERKRSALRLRDKSPENYRVDFHVDVVPGRYIDDDREDVFLYQNGGEKKRLKTNPQVHIDHIKGSGVVPAIRLLKLWKTRKASFVKQFVFELLVIDLVADKKSRPLSEQLEHFWSEVDELEDSPKVEDPANPEGNDLSSLLDASNWAVLRSHARDALHRVKNDQWETIFGPVEDDDSEESSQATSAAIISEAARSVDRPSKPWCPEE